MRKKTKRTKSFAMKGVQRIKGDYDAGTLRGRFAIVVSDFNEYLTRQLLEGALDTFLRHGVQSARVTVVHVPGAFEIPLAVKKILRRNKFDAVIALGVIIQGQTRHFEQVTAETARALSDISRSSEIPVILGIIPAYSVQEAIERVGIKQLNKGREWALSALEMASLIKKLRKT